MTTYAYYITLNDSEAIMLKAALEIMIQHCQEKLDKGERSPYWAHKMSAKSVLNKLYDKWIQTSGNNFWEKE